MGGLLRTSHISHRTSMFQDYDDDYEQAHE
jgi:hypothetical protein